MKPDSGWIFARGQIAWLVGLIVSTAIVVQLERLELGRLLVGLDTNPLAASDMPATQTMLDLLRARVSDAETASAEDLAALLLALSSAGLQDPDPSLRVEALALLDGIPAPIADNALLIEVRAVTERVFGE